MSDLQTPASSSELPDCRYKPSSLQSAGELLRRFPPRKVTGGWEATRLSRGRVLQQLLSPPFARESHHAQQVHHRGVRAVLDWLAEFPGDTWQDRLLASTTVAEGDNCGWKYAATMRLSSVTGEGISDKSGANLISTGLLALICGDVVRPDPAWLMSPRTPKNLTMHMARTRDPHGWARLRAQCDVDPAGAATKATALSRIAVIMAAKGGTVAQITVGDCLELLQRACHSICVSPGWSIIGPPLGRTEGVFCDEDHAVAG